MGMNFPNSPTPGQLYTPVGGYQYVFLDGVWRVVEAPQDVGTAQTRNRIVNGAMQVSQENGNTAGTANNYYPADQWYMNWSGTTAVVSVQQSIVTPSTISRTRLLATVTTADTLTTGARFVCLNTKLEGSKVSDFGWPNGKTAVLRFDFAGPAGTYTAHIRNGAADRSWLGSFTISAGEANTIVTRSLVVPSPLDGTWPTDTAVGMYVGVSISAGAGILGVAGWQSGNLVGLPGQANGVGTVSNAFQLTNVGLYCDPLNTGIAPPWVMPDEAEELRACQRYYYKGGHLFSGNVTTGLNYYATSLFPIMRTAPAFSGVNVANSQFGATVGTFENRSYFFDEVRGATATANGGFFMTTTTLNARM